MLETSADKSFATLLPQPAHLQLDGSARPRPVEFVPDYGDQRLPGATRRRIDAAVARLNARLARICDGDGVPGTLHLSVPATPAWPEFGAAEGFELEIAECRLALQGESAWGVLHGLELLLQLCLEGPTLPCGTIQDQPAYPWRGLMLDVARHFLPIPALERTIDCMAAVRLNVLHLHLTDDQAFRFRSTAFPRLASDQAYGADALSALVAFAADRGIRVVPELDVPGHVTHMLVAHPEWAPRNAEGLSLARNLAMTKRFGVHPGCLDPLSEEVRVALGTLLDELCACFPDAYLHVGGDEVHPGWWQEAEGLASTAVEVSALQARFNLFLHGALKARGRRMLAWDEVLHPTLAKLEPPVTVQNWRGATTRDRALAAGHPCIVSSGFYLDLHYGAHWHHRYDPGARQSALLALEDELLTADGFAAVADGMRWTHQWREGSLQTDQVPPIACGADDAASAVVLGGEACLWSELVDEQTLDVRLWSRLPAIAERFWRAPEPTDVVPLESRQACFLEGLRRTGRNDLAARQRAGLLGAGVPISWQPLYDWFEPLKWYARLLGTAALRARLGGREMPQARPYDIHTPLTAAVDHLPVVSVATAVLAQDIAGARAPDAVVRACCERWQMLLAMPDVPEAVRPARDRLARLAALCARRLAAGTLDAAAQAELAHLAEPEDDLLLAPVFALRSWLLAAPVPS
jgi:hexosaminidase